MDEDVIGGRVSLVAEDGECRNFHRSVRALPASRGHAGHITCRYDIAGHSLNSRLCRVPASGGGWSRLAARPWYTKFLTNERAPTNAAENALRQFARWMIADAGLDSIAAVRRDDIEDYKVWLAARPRAGGQVITAETHRQRIRTIRQFFERSSSGTGPTRRPVTRSLPGTSRKSPSRCRSSSTTATQPG